MMALQQSTNTEINTNPAHIQQERHIVYWESCPTELYRVICIRPISNLNKKICSLVCTEYSFTGTQHNNLLIHGINNQKDTRLIV